MCWSNVSGAFSLLWPEKSDRKCWRDRGLMELTAEKKIVKLYRPILLPLWRKGNGCRSWLEIKAFKVIFM